MLPVASEAVLAAAAVATAGGGGRGGGGGHGQALCVHVGGEGTRTRHAVPRSPRASRTGLSGNADRGTAGAARGPEY